MANIKSIGGNPIVLGLDGLTDDAKAALGSGAKLSAAAESILGTPDTAQWAQRVTAGSGAATVRSVQGAAVSFNQHINLVDRTATSKGITYTAQDGKVTLSAPNGAEGQESFYTDLNNAINIVAGHKYLIAGGSENGVRLLVAGQLGLPAAKNIETASADASGTINVMVSSTFTGTHVCYPQCIDLTAMFGSGNEPATVAEFEAMYPASYYPYSAPTLKPVQIAGISSTDANGAALDSVEWTAKTLRAAGSVSDELTADELVTRVGAVDLGTLSWGAATAEGRVETTGKFVSDVKVTGKTNVTKPELTSDTGLTVLPYYTGGADAYRTDGSISIEYSGGQKLFINDSNLANMTAAQVKTALSGKTLYYELATPTTTPISPALDMTYRVQAGGSESIIVPSGEISAAPILTVAEGESAADVVMDALACIAAPDGTVATASHAVNTYLTMQGKLYKVTSAIAVGETIKSGTNVTETTVMAELIARTA